MVTLLDSAQARPRHASPRRVSVNGIVIRQEDIASEIQNHPAPTHAAAWTAAAQALVIRELLFQEARRLNVSAESQADAVGRRETADEAMLRALVEREVMVPVADEASCRRYYEQNSRRFRSADIFEVSHILLAAPPSDREARDQARRQAFDLIAELREQPARLAALAEQFSSCPSRQVGGSLGQIGPGQTVPEFEMALGSMPVGEVHGQPVESRFGIHVVLVSRREQGRDLPFEAVRARIGAYLEERARRVAIRHYIEALSARAVVEGIKLAPDGSPLVQ